MKQFKTIHVLVSGEPAAVARCVDEAAALAKKHGAELRLVDCSDPLPWHAALLGRVSAEDLRAALTAQRQARLEELATPLCESGLKVTVSAGPCRRLDEALEDAGPGKSELGIVAYAPSTGVRKALLGDPLTLLVERARIPLWLVKFDAPKPGNGAPVVASIEPVPGENGRNAMSRRVIELARMLADGIEAPLEILHVWDAYGEPFFRRRNSGSNPELSGFTNRVAKHVEEFVHSIEPGIDTARIKLIKGEPRTSLPEYANRETVGTIAAGVRRRTRAGRILKGNTIESLLLQAPCSVLAVPEVDA